MQIDERAPNLPYDEFSVHTHCHICMHRLQNIYYSVSVPQHPSMCMQSKLRRTNIYAISRIVVHLYCNLKIGFFNSGFHSDFTMSLLFKLVIYSNWRWEQVWKGQHSSNFILLVERILLIKCVLLDGKVEEHISFVWLMDRTINNISSFIKACLHSAFKPELNSITVWFSKGID